MAELFLGCTITSGVIDKPPVVNTLRWVSRCFIKVFSWIFLSSDRAVTSYYERDNQNVDFILPIMTFPYDFKQNKWVKVNMLYL